MPLFHYVGLNKQQKQLSGVIDAADEANAQQKLSELGIAVIKISTEAPQDGSQESHEGKTVFEFEALDTGGKKVVGTIVAESPLLAYKRLIEEYQLQVNALFDAALTPEQKEAARAAGTADIQKQYKDAYSIPEQASSLTEQSPLADQNRALILQKVEMTMQKIQNFLETYGAQMKHEERSTMQGYMNQLERIKNSSNIDHVLTTCKRMLQHVQEKELFAQEELRDRAGMKLKVETGELLKELKKTSALGKPIELEGIIEKFEKKTYLSPLAKILRAIVPHETKEMHEIRSQIKMTNKHMLAYLKVALTGKSPQSKSEAWNSISTLRAEKKRLKTELAGLQEKAQEAAHAQKIQTTLPHHSTAQQFFGWMLFVYLVFYIATYPLTMKEITNFQLPQFLYFYQSTILKSLTLFTLIAYGCIAISNIFFPEKRLASIALYGAGIFSFLLIAINLI
ncbi:hypothetical protein COV82_01760 [Candidatus Peregrinibacteria bacterium CG11_big_fil_rev_8_21_14_0_20_46_8]|nr:MAG: hypothetical protein COV82_01760 [Candidatus Peregrinibacteria bacterium CG11_big_fil_rev_8_21_14_0_20_46_8]